MPLNIESIQKDLRAAKLDGWLFYDFRGAGPHRAPHPAIARRHAHAALVYFVPAKGTPKKLVHKIEAQALVRCRATRFIFPRRKSCAAI